LFCLIIDIFVGMKRDKIISFILIALLGISLISCAATKKRRMKRDCGCGSFSETEVIIHDTHA
jgi:hypothetical protein